MENKNYNNKQCENITMKFYYRNNLLEHRDNFVKMHALWGGFMMEKTGQTGSPGQRMFSFKEFN